MSSNSVGYKIVEGEIFLDKDTGKVIITGDVDNDDESHNCDQMGCSTVSHVIYRSGAQNDY